MPLGNPSVKATAAPSGQSIVLVAEDGGGTITNITSLATANEVQSIQLTGEPSGGQFTLSFGGRTTTPIPTVLSLPVIYLEWTFPTVAGHTYNVSVTWNNWRGTSTCEYGFDVLQNNAVLASIRVDGGIPPDTSGGFTDPGVNLPITGTPVYWLPVNSAPLTASATSMTLLCSASPGNFFRLQGCRVQDITAGTITYYDSTTVGARLHLEPFLYNGTNAFHGVDIEENFGGTGLFGTTYTVDSGSSTSAQVLQSALESLSSIGSGNIAVNDQGNGSYQAVFTGTLADVPQSLLTCPDSAVAITRVTAGGSITPTLTINGGSPIPLSFWIYDQNEPSPYAFFPLYQAPPAVQTASQGIPPCLPLVGDWRYYGGSPVAFAPGAEMDYQFTHLKAGTYRFAINYSTTTQTWGGGLSQVYYPPSSATQFLVKDGNGTTLATYSVDQTQTPADYTDQGRGWKILGSFTTSGPSSTLTLIVNTVGIPAQSGNVQQVALLDAVQLTRTSADDSLVIGPGDVATLNIQSNWITTSAGVVPAITNLAVTRDPILPPFVANQKTMKAGMNVQAAGAAYNFFSHSNLAYTMASYWNGRIDSNGYPTALFSSTSPARQSIQVATNPFASTFGDTENTYQINAGKFVVTWIGDPTCGLQGRGGTTVTELTVTKPSNVTGNWKVYEVSLSAGTASPYLEFFAQSTTPDPSDLSGNSYLINLTALAIYPPDPSDPTGQTIWGLDTGTNQFTPPPKFHPWFLYKLQGMQCLRYLGISSTNDNGCTKLADYKPITHADRLNPTHAYYNIGVSQISPPSDPYFVPNPGNIIFEVTTSSPHGLSDGRQVVFYGCGTGQFASGSYVLDYGTNPVMGLIHVVDATHLICYVYVSGSFGTVITNTVTPTAGVMVVPVYGSLWPLEDMVDLTVAVGCNDMWFNIPVNIDATPGGGAYQVAARLASLLPSGVKLHAEYGNECWNATYATYKWCSYQENILNNNTAGTYGTYYASQGKAVLDQFQAAFTAAGRANDLIRVFGAQAGNPGATDEILTKARSIGAPIDELCIATYYSNWPAYNYSQNQCPTFDAMTIDQLLDYMELISVYGNYPAQLVANQIPVLAAHGYSATKMTAYEGGASNLVPVNPAGGDAPGNDPNYVVRQNAVKRHPRMYGVTLQMAQEFQDAGLTLWNYFDLGFATVNYYCWDIYESGNMKRGTGNPAIDTSNAHTPQAKNEVLSEMGGGWHYWSTLSAPTTTINWTASGRNGLIRAIGLPRGMLRPTRSH